MKHPQSAAAVFEFLASLDPPLDPESTMPQLESFANVLAKHAERLNLLSASQRNFDSVWAHILDSLQPLAVKTLGSARMLLDAGSGGGLPGVPLAVALPDAKVVLIERSNTKAEFLELVKALVPLPNAEVKCESLESALRDQPSDAVVLARALTPPANWGSILKKTKPTLSWVIFATDHNKKEWLSVATEHGLAAVATHEYNLSNAPGNRVILHFCCA